jgi:hypothetical protein
MSSPISPRMWIRPRSSFPNDTDPSTRSTKSVWSAKIALIESVGLSAPVRAKGCQCLGVRQRTRVVKLLLDPDWASAC